ncbi:hypothetical protein O181_038783 [Austropuccinia psidii MF-1]|uniref:Integrase catalytic domain-containing protein n=1 Tax=Austropuccinia psidii MF-1 TaxID=1389203 RepID=A0A9Q3DC32_9BASI|nr:hypothetical protein [Austropuccinia psidii MF-1]
MDFITQLPLLNGFDSILVVVDRVSKMAIFIPAYGEITALDLAQIIIDHVFSKHGIPASIVSDRGSLFVSAFWTQLCQKLKVSRDLSTDFHPEADGQTERENQILDHYLWMYVSYHQDVWHTWLTLAEFAYNNAIYSSTKLTCWKVINKAPISTASSQRRIRVNNNKIQEYTDRNRTITPYFKPGDKVWLASKNIKTKRPTKKLSERWLGPL